jgi:DNA invertase Pin-like site-specific DNA recombinase
MTVTLNATAKPILGYVRVSTEDQAGEHRLSLPEQRRAIAERAHALDGAVVRVFEDAGVSGSTAEGRPGFMQLVGYCERHPTLNGIVLVLNDSRFGRFDNPEESAFWRVTLARQGWTVRFVENDADDPMARGVLRAVGSIEATAARRAIQANAVRGARTTAQAGRWRTEAPLGYRRRATGPRGVRVLEPGQRKADDEYVTLTPGPARERAIITFMFSTYANGMHSLGTLARRLRERFPARRWSTQTVRQVLVNPVYVGDVLAMRRVHRTTNQRRDPSEWVIVSNAHPPLVSRDMFDAVQDRLRRNRRELRRTTGGYALSGLLTCAHCDGHYVGHGGPMGPPDDPDRYRYYADTGGELGRCPGPLGTLQRRVVEPQVIDAVAHVVSSPIVARAIERELDRLLATDGREGRQALMAEQADLERQADRLAAAVARGVLTDDLARREAAQLRAKRATVTAQLEEARFRSRRQGTLRAERNRLVALARDFATQARRLHGAALRELLRPWLASAVVDKARREIVLNIRQVPGVALFGGSSLSPGRG